MKQTMKYLIIFFLTTIISCAASLEDSLGFQNNLSGQQIPLECNNNYIELNLTANESLYIGSIKLASDSLGFNSVQDGIGFFGDEHRFRNDSRYLEYFDEEPFYKTGSLTVRLENESDELSRILPGYYQISFFPSLDRIDGSHIQIDPLNMRIGINSGVDFLNVSAIDRKNRINTVTMGDDFSLRFSDMFTGVDDNSISIYTKYHGLQFNRASFYLNDSINQTFPEILDTRTYDLQKNIICPIEDMRIDITNSCGLRSLVVHQTVPDASDIYYQVDRVFNFEETYRVSRIYYMVGAYFNCRRDDATAFL